MFPLVRPATGSAAALLVAALCTPASAAEAGIEAPPAPRFSWSKTTTFVSDYRARGLSCSDRAPAAQASLGVEHDSGLYGFVDASTVRFARDRDVEIAAGAGWTTTIGALGELDLAAAYISYARFAAGDYVEGSAQWRRPLGPVTPFLAVDFVPSQIPVRGRRERLGSNLYLHGGAEWKLPGTPLHLSGEIGRERGSLVPGGGTKWDWQVGASASLGGIDWGLSYVDTRVAAPDAALRRMARGGLVLSARAGF